MFLANVILRQAVHHGLLILCLNASFGYSELGFPSTGFPGKKIVELEVITYCSI